LALSDLRAAGIPDATGDLRAAVPSLLRVSLQSGGDERLALLPETGRNRYGIPPGPAPQDVWFASSTASPVSPRGSAAAAAMLARLIAPRRGETATAWPDAIRSRLLTLFGIDGASVILTASGTEAELIVLALARHVLARPITSIIVAPGETGSGVGMAAGGAHFLASAPFAPVVARGSLLAGLEPGAVATDHVDIRCPAGQPIAVDAVDRAIVAKAERAIGAGRDVIVHILDTSKTGLVGGQRSMAAALRGVLRGRSLVVVDACQLRCSPEQIRADLASGFVVMLTGSKFAGGPPFSGAVLVPPCLMGQLEGLEHPAGLSAYTAMHDWPAALRGRDGGSFGDALNLGLYVRWEAALAELERYYAVALSTRRRIVERFAALVTDLAGDTSGVRLLPSCVARPLHEGTTILALTTMADDGTAMDAPAVHRALAVRGSDHPCGGDRIFNVGQPVAVGSAAVLRVCLSAPQVVDVAGRMAAGRGLAGAIEPLASDLRALFAKWSRVRDRLNAAHAAGAGP
jgi:hypothetical protein